MGPPEGTRSRLAYTPSVAQQRRKKKKRSRHDPQRAEANRQREEQRRRDHEARRLAEEAAQRKQALRRRLRGLALPVIGGVAVMAVALVIFTPDPEVTGVTRVDEVEATELAVGATFDYGTPTPTSGPYLPGSATCGVFDEQVPAVDAVTAQRVGAVVLWHRPDVGDDVRGGLAGLAAETGSHVIVSVNADMADPVVATAWNRLKAYDGLDEELAEFIDTYAERGPEDGPCAG